MPSLRVSLNGQCLAEVDVAGLDVLNVRVSGARVDGDLAEVHMSGAAFPTDAAPTTLFWFDDPVVLNEGDRVEVSFNAVGSTSHPGKTINELFPGKAEAHEKVNVLDLLPQVIQELRAEPYVREGYRFAVEPPGTQRYEGTTGEGDHGFGFSVLWNSHRPERASVSFHTYVLDDLEHRRPMPDHVRTHLAPGDTASLQLWTLHR